VSRQVSKQRLSILVLSVFVILIAAIVALERLYDIGVNNGVVGGLSVLAMGMAFKVANSGRLKWVLKKDAED
jgi:hypothetical protein